MTTSAPLLPCPSCLARALSRRWTGVTEVDTFSTPGGAWTEHHYEDLCGRCGWRRQGRGRLDPSSWRDGLSRDARLFRFGADKMATGATFSEVGIRTAPPPVWPALGEVRSSRALAGLLEARWFRAVSVSFDTDAGTCELYCRPIDLAHAASALEQARAQATFGRALVGEGSTALELDAPPRSVARLVKDGVEQWVGPPGLVLDAIARLWRGHHQALLDTGAGCAAPVVAALRALGAGVPVPASPIEPLAEGLELLERLAPAIHREVLGTLDGTDGREVWRGARVSGELPWAHQVAGWIDQNRARDDAYFFRLRPGRVTILTRLRGRLAVMDDAFSVTDLVGIAARIAFFWEHRGTFVDGLSLVQGKLDGIEQVRVAASEPLRLVALLGDHAALVIEPKANITVGRASDNDLVLAHRLVSKRQSLLSLRDGAWFVRDAGSTSGTWVEQSQIRTETALHFGDRVALGGLVMLVV